jgi:hypothetical protein
MKHDNPAENIHFTTTSPNSLRRRTFLKMAGATALAIAVPELVGRNLRADSIRDGVNLGSGDIGVLNYAYALEQLEAAFYTRVASSFYAGISGGERQILTDIRDHEIAHRDFLRAALGGSAIPELQFKFDSIHFGNRQSVLTTSMTFEDIGVSAYNGAGQLLRDPGHLLTAGKILSVEARHAAVIRELLRPQTDFFGGADIVDAFGLGAVDAPDKVLREVSPYVVTPINADNLPKSRN